MTLLVDFRADGLPKPQGSKRAFVMGGKARLVESGGAGHKDWRATVNQAAHHAYGERPPIEGPLAVTMRFYLPRPKSHPKRKRTWPVARPDIDKLVRSVCDSLTHVVWKDDSQIVSLRAEKAWAYVDAKGGPGVDVVVSTLDD